MLSLAAVAIVRFSGWPGELIFALALASCRSSFCSWLALSTRSLRMRACSAYCGLCDMVCLYRPETPCR